ncbi:hypothetical protein [Dyadobacter tibetensis]|uniref:hypothetical protein n=1 Tax=Dyadobacter tibetensis TaxID=1211851 RepID=UPI0004707363|nr:hypothetical protein [Dyadobacter tibetensis]
MRYVKDIPHNQFKIGLYHWNNKYIIKIETGSFEQTYKIDEYEVSGVEEIDKVIDENFMQAVSLQFHQMHQSLQATLLRNEIIF